MLCSGQQRRCKLSLEFALEQGRGQGGLQWAPVPRACSSVAVAGQGSYAAPTGRAVLLPHVLPWACPAPAPIPVGLAVDIIASRRRLRSLGPRHGLRSRLFVQHRSRRHFHGCVCAGEGREQAAAAALGGRGPLAACRAGPRGFAACTRCAPCARRCPPAARTQAPALHRAATDRLHPRHTPPNPPRCPTARAAARSGELAGRAQRAQLARAACNCACPLRRRPRPAPSNFLHCAHIFELTSHPGC